MRLSSSLSVVPVTVVSVTASTLSTVMLTFALTAASLLTAGCSDDAPPAGEPVAAETGEAGDLSAPPDDASGMPQGDGMGDSAGDGMGSTADDGSGSSDAPPAEEELPGSLTDDPYGAPQPPGGAGDTGVADATAPDAATGDDYGGAFDAPPEPTPEGAAPAPAAAGKSGKVTRYVDAIMLNVRSKPSLKAPVVRRLLGGAKISVEVHGKYAKLRNGQWVKTKYLSAAPTKKVSRQEAERAWRGKAPAAKKKKSKKQG